MCRGLGRAFGAVDGDMELNCLAKALMECPAPPLPNPLSHARRAVISLASKNDVTLSILLARLMFN